MPNLKLSLALSVAVAALGVCAAAQDMPPLPQPGPEHAIFKEVAGTWDAKVETFMGPGEPAVSEGVEVNRLSCGGLCLVSSFEGSMMGTKFEGHGTETWDTAKKKYIGSWTDSMSTGMTVTESTYDPSTKTMTGWMESADMAGNVIKMKSTSKMTDADTRLFEMHNVGPDGEETLGMRITYTRRE